MVPVKIAVRRADGLCSALGVVEPVTLLDIMRVPTTGSAHYKAARDRAAVHHGSSQMNNLSSRCKFVQLELQMKDDVKRGPLKVATHRGAVRLRRGLSLGLGE